MPIPPLTRLPMEESPANSPVRRDFAEGGPTVAFYGGTVS